MVSIFPSSKQCHFFSLKEHLVIKSDEFHTYLYNNKLLNVEIDLYYHDHKYFKIIDLLEKPTKYLFMFHLLFGLKLFNISSI